MLDKTMIFSINGDRDQEIKNAMISVYNSLKQKGYNPINQIVGYLMSGDPAYIPRLNDARNLIKRHERDEIIEELVRVYLKK